MVFQSYALYPTMSVAQNIAFGLEMRKVPKPERDKAIARVARMLQIEHLLARKPAALSGGQRQRVAMGRALARDPKLFLFDEPLSNLDAKLRVEMRAEIKLLHQRTRVTTVYVTHDQVEAMTLGDRIAVMRGGRIEQLGSPGDIYGRPATRYVAEFIGSPAMNFIAAERRGDGLMCGELALTMSDAQRDALRHSKAPKLLYGVRPEALSLSAQGLAGSIKMVEPTGPDTYALVDTAVGTLTARVPGTLAQRAGEQVRVSWSPSQTHLFDADSQQRIG
jgi:multiple sugar transport system ATP-binding protein